MLEEHCGWKYMDMDTLIPAYNDYPKSCQQISMIASKVQVLGYLKQNNIGILTLKDHTGVRSHDLQTASRVVYYWAKGISDYNL